MMNNEDLIKKETLLFGYIAEYAQQSKFSVTLNRFFREANEDAMIVPMNIREDDLYFTIAGLRDAQLRGVAIGSEYVYDAFNIVDFKSEKVQSCEFCDTITVKDKKLYGEIGISLAINRLLEEKNIQNIAILGSGKLAKAILLDVRSNMSVTLFADRVESCMELMNSLDGKNEKLSFDIERTSVNIDFSSYDAVINTTPSHDNFTTINPAKVMIDITKNNELFKQFQASSIEYFNEESLVPYLTQSCFKIWTQK